MSIGTLKSWGAMALCLLALSVSCHAADLAVGDEAPAYVGRTVGGDPVTLSSYAGKAIVISYWATWCPYCLKELPILNNIQKAAGKDRMQVIAINTESRDVFRRVVRGLGDLDLQLAYDPGEVARTAYGVKGIPHMVIIGHDGRIEAVFRGYSEESLDDIVAAINRATGATK